VLLFVFFGCSKKKSVNSSIHSNQDSVPSYLTKANDDQFPRVKKQYYARKAFDIIISQENDSLNRTNLFRVANRYYNINDWVDYKKTVFTVLEKSKISKDSLSSAKAYTYLADYYGAQAIPDSAYLYYFKAEKMYLQLNNNYSLAKTRLSKATLQYNESDFKGSEIAVFNALRALNGDKVNDILFDSYNLLGLIYNELGEFDKAIEYMNKALESIDDKVIPIVFQSKATSLNNLGYIYQNINNHNQAKIYLQQALDQKGLFVDKTFVYAALIDNLAYSKFKLKETKNLPDLFYNSLKLRDSLHLTTGIIISKIHLSEYFASKKDTLKAIQFSNEALATARNSNNHRNLLLPLKQLAVIEPKRAVSFNKEYIRVNDSLQKADRKMGNKFTRIEYETDQIKQENTDLTTQNRNLVYFFGSVLILGMFLYIIKAQKVKNRELLYKQEQQKVNEEIYNLMISQQGEVETTRIKEKKRVAQELHDGVLGRMFGVRMNLDSLNKINDEEGASQRNAYLSELKSIEQDIREISHDLNREKSELINNFVAIVDNLFEDQKKTFNPQLVSTIDSDIKWELMSNIVKINLYRIVQESLQNINKYANANLIKVEFKKEIDNLRLVIIDDGVGFNVNKGKKGIGLQNMLSRINECQGTFDIKSKIGQGTTITVTVPI
jgi:signal transduction histidine kinase